MKLRKGSILYHTTNEKFIEKPNEEKPFLFCTFHPSEYPNKYVNFIKLKKDISLLFMIETIKGNRIFSSLNLFTNNKNKNLSKTKLKNLLCYAEKIKMENLDGWFTSIENKASVEVALLNDTNLFEVIKKGRFNNNTNNMNENKIKDWGKKYKICTTYLPMKLKINIRYKEMIEKYKKSGDLKMYIFQVLLDNCNINYHKGELKNFSWKC